MNVPSRKQRNQPSNRVHDIEFATEISTSLLAQVRQLQALLAEKEETLKATNLEKSRLELDAQGFSQRLRSLDESEQRYKDENWSLETQTHDLIAAAKESADREQRLQQTLAVISAEKSSAQRELDDIKQAHGKLADEHAAFRKGHESELVALRKNVSMRETERGMLERRVEDLQSQNQELAKAYAARIRGDEEAPVGDLGPDPEPFSLDRSDPEHSPPPSPSKGMPRHNALESETLKSSLHHAHRMIQNLKSNVHREKTEKAELKRLLQESRDELEIRRSESNGASSGNRKTKTKSQVEPMKRSAKPSTLGIGRNSRTDIEHLEEPGWEDHNGEGSPHRLPATAETRGIKSDPTTGKFTDVSDAYQTANETDAFETANERDTATESEAFQTGNESLAGESSDELTETEGRPARSGTVKERKPSPLSAAKPGNRSSFISTASTSGSEDDREVKTPIQAQPQKYRLRINRGSRRSRMGSEGPTTNSNTSSMKNSPASFISTNGQPGQSLFAELGDLNGNESGEEMDGTPSRTSIYSQRSNSISRPSTTKQLLPSVETQPPIPPLPMVDSSMMTEPTENATPSRAQAVPSTVAAPISTPETSRTRDFGVQRTPADTPQNVSTSTSTSSPPRPVWDQPLENFVQNIPTFGPALTSTPTSTRSGAPREVQTFDTPRSTRSDAMPESPMPPSFTFTQIQSLELEPIEPAPIVPSRDARRAVAAETTSMPRPSTSSVRPSTSDAEHKDSSKGGVLDTVLGWARPRRPSAPKVAEDETVKESESQPKEQSRVPFQEVPANIMQRQPVNKDIPGIQEKSMVLDMADQGSQTILSADQIDNLMNRKNNMPPPINTSGNQRSSAAVMKPLSDIGATIPALQRKTSKDSLQSANKPTTIREAAPLTKTFPRPGSSSSARASSSAMPPLPPDHQKVIAAAAQRTSIPDGPANNIMGPPMVPASAYRSASNRPRTPSEQRRPSPNRRTSTTPRTARYSTARSQISRRSSMSSFESELDARFNIRTDGGMPMPQGLEPGTDPRMIQAITQTMIGEYLWKYTRKAGRGEMSTNRHRRFFWVHPYTRTLYWGDQDPATAGRGGLKSKSVAIEAVRVVVDDNPMPPGLHRKSLIVITPGRSVKFTATTGQRHETWFNALSYLLLRTGPETTASQADSSALTADDVAEFNPTYRPAPTAASRASRVSLSSYNSRTPRTVSRTGSPIRPSSTARSFVPSSSQQHQVSTSSRHSELPQGSLSRFSHYWRPNRSSVRGSVSSQRSRSSVVGQQQQQLQQGQHGQGGIQPGAAGFYDASVVHGSAEDLREVIARQEAEADRLENVRACCDGEFASHYLCVVVLVG